MIDSRLRKKVKALKQSSLHTCQSDGTAFFGELVLSSEEVPRAVYV
jgi:hypothetical protein